MAQKRPGNKKKLRQKKLPKKRLSRSKVVKKRGAKKRVTKHKLSPPTKKTHRKKYKSTHITEARERKLEALIRGAGDKLLQYWPGKLSALTQPHRVPNSTPKSLEDKNNLNITQKKDGSFVTRADYESNEILMSGLKTLFPYDGIFSEEVIRDERLSSTERVWIIDPLDGTQSFIDGNDDFSILVGLCVGKGIDFGMMYFPVRNQFAIGKKGGGAAMNGSPLHVSTSKSLRDRSIYLRHVKLDPKPYFYDKWMDSGMAFLSLCRGDFDGIIMKLIHHQEWDLAAPSVMITESGGRVTDEFGEPFSFKKAPVTSKYLVASNGYIHSELLEMIPKT